MPGGDGTGPLGTGPTTGRGMGRCGYPIRPPFGGRRFWGCGRGVAPYGGYGVADPVQEKERLADMEKALSEQLDEVRRMQARMENAQDQE